MLTNLQLTAYSPRNSANPLTRIPLHDKLQTSIEIEWSQQLRNFCQGIREIKFDAGYKPESDDRFVIEGFALPEIIETNRQGLDTLDSFRPDVESLRNLSALLAYAQDGNREVIILQRFTKSHVIKPGQFLFKKGDIFESVDSPAMTLGPKPDAVFFPEVQKLIFHNFRNANSILPLADFYEEASEDEIREVLQHPRLAAEDIDTLAVDAPQWYRTRFSMLRDSKVLDAFTPAQIRKRATGYLDIAIQGRGSKARVVFPKDRPGARRLLQFLNEELYKGPITEKLYETNSKRTAD